MRHIVTGGAGMIGSHLVDALAARGEEVLVIDNFARGCVANLYAAAKTGLVKVRALNLENSGFPIQPDDVVWHLAAKVAGIEYNRTHHYEMLRANLAINTSVIESVRRQKPRLFVFVSTACVYPHDAPVPTPESAANGNPEPTNYGYGMAKWLGEQMVKHLSKEHNQACLIPRFFNVIGERDYYDKESSHVVPALIRRVMEGENPIRVWGSGKQTRVFVDSRDIAQALILLMERDWLDYQLGDTPVVNIGHEREISIAEVVETVVRASGKDVGYEFDTTKPDGHARRAADVTKLRSLIGWVPSLPLSDSIARMMAEYKSGRARSCGSS